jgi:HD-GYP domain-containing protein (c-di-GMP phosphodiesterase class II)
MLQKTSAKDLKIGMFVADLDRPWMDTPFLLQGFVLEDADQVAQVKQHCQWVMIDPLRSVGPDFNQKPAKKEPIPKRDLGTDPIVVVHRAEAPRPLTIDEMKAANQAQAAARFGKAGGGDPNASGKFNPSESGKFSKSGSQSSKLGEFAIPISQRDAETPAAADLSRTSPGMKASKDLGRGSAANGAATGGFKGLFGQLKADVKNLFSSAPKENFEFEQYDAETGAKVEVVRPSFIPETVQLTIYEDKAPVESELGAATNAFAKTQELLQHVVEDIRAGNHMQVKVIESVIEDMVDSMVRNPDAMMWVARMREQSTLAYDHGLSVAISLVAFGRHLGFPKEQLSQLGVMGLLLDIGKIRISKELLEKTGRLTPQEFVEMKKHVKHGMEILSQTANVNPDVVEGVSQHHERMDGSGYPYGLSGKDISIYGKMSAIADTYAAITKKRPYAEPVSPHDALQMLSNWGGTQFQADMVEHFIQSIGVFPVGSLVELSTSEVAVVVTHNKQKRLRPKVLIVTDPDKALRKHPSVKDLIYDVSDNPIYIRRGLPSNAFGIDASEYYLA